VSTLLVASGGGHLRQLVELAPRLRGVDADFLWVTWDAPQSRSLLADRDVVWVRHTPPRSPLAVGSNIDFAIQLWSRKDHTALVTTGSQIVLPFLAVGRARGRSCHFIESAARSNGPSLTGQISSYLPGMCLYSQYPGWADRRWRCVGSVFDGFQVEPLDHPLPPRARVVVTLGTMPGWEFRRLVEACIRVIPADSDVLWQTGATDVSGLPIAGKEALPSAELENAIARADVVISHAGVGSALSALRLGKLPILVPREAARKEHVDDHQQEIATELGDRGLALIRTPESLVTADLGNAAGMKIIVPTDLAPIELESRPRPARAGFRRRL
jgi:UDP-N-acetylglucosamine--N-acetylmuramyl-(pentapeptide) pyrophosphoryl-undecaprenol N-acetylglucosamine transferase